MGGTARKFSPCAVSWADGLAHGTARHGDTGGTEERRASTAHPCRVPCRAGTVAIYTAQGGGGAAVAGSEGSGRGWGGVGRDKIEREVQERFQASNLYLMVEKFV
jgi:hypothetical protein